MIKGNVVLCGRVCHAATLKPNKQGEIYTNFSVKVGLPVGAGNTKDCWVSVRKKGGTTKEQEQYFIGTPVEIAGILNFRKNKEDVYLNLTAESIEIVDDTKPECITGEIEFYGKIGTEPEMKLDKHGNKYLYFSGFSSEMSGEERVFIWVRFIRFSGEKENFMEKGNGIHLNGTLDILFYHDHLSLGCRFKEVERWVKEKTVEEKSEKKMTGNE